MSFESLDLNPFGSKSPLESFWVLIPPKLTEMRICPNTMLRSLTTSVLKAYADGSIVITLTPGLTMEKLQAQIIRSRL